MQNTTWKKYWVLATHGHAPMQSAEGREWKLLKFVVQFINILQKNSLNHNSKTVENLGFLVFVWETAWIKDYVTALIATPSCIQQRGVKVQLNLKRNLEHFIKKLTKSK